MGKVELSFSDGHHVSFAGNTKDEIIDKYIEVYLSEHEGVKLEEQLYSEMDEYVEDDQQLEITDAEQLDPKEEFDEDKNFLLNETIKFFGTRNPETKDDEEASGEFGSAKGMDIEALKVEINNLCFYRTISVIKNNLPDTWVDTPLKDITEEMISNALGNMGYVGSYSENRQMWQCVVNLRGGIMVVYDDTLANTLLRAFIFTRTGTYYHNNDLIDQMIDYWQKVNESKEDPRSKTKEYLNNVLSELGTSVDDINDEYDRQVGVPENQKH